MPTIQDLNSNVSLLGSSMHSLGGHVEITTIFGNKDTGAATNVYNPNASFKKEGVDMYPEVLVPFSPTGRNIGEYRMCFITGKDWSAGQYEVTLSGYSDPEGQEGREGSRIEQKGTFEVLELSKKQSYIEMLRNVAADDLPELYVIDDPTKFKWSDGMLHNYLQLSVSAWNSTPPMSTSGTSLYYDPDSYEKFPFIDLLMTGAELYALNKKVILEIWNTLSYQDDLTFNLDRAPKLMQKYSMIAQQYYLRLSAAKKDAAMRATYSLGAKALIGTKLPFRIIRALSFNKGWSIGLGATGSFTY